jgi:hypothetical protein
MPQSRKRDTALHELVHSLTQAERRYYILFTRQSAHSEASTYESIFHALLQMPVYDEQSLIDQAAKTPMRTHFSAFKYQMQSHILRAMRHFHENRDAERTLLEANASLAILAEKGLWKIFDKTLQKAQRLAQSHQRWHHQLRLLDWQRTAIHHSPSPINSLLQIQVDEQQVLQHLAQEHHLKSLHARIRLLAKQRGTAPATAPQDTVQAILSEFQVQNPAAPQSTVAAICYHNLLGIAALLQAQYTEAFTHLNEARKHWFAQPAIITLEQDLFRVSLTNFFNACLFTDQMEAHAAAEDDLVTLGDLSTTNRLHLDDLRHYNRLRYALNRARLEDGHQLIPEIEAWLQVNAHHIDPARTMHFWHNIQLFHFFAADWRSALRYTRRIQNQAHPELRADIAAFSDIMELLLLHETDDPELLSYRLRAYQRKIHRKKGFPLGETVVKLLNAILLDAQGPIADHARRPLKPNAAEQTPWETALTKLQTLETQDKPPFGYWELRIWVESHATQTPLPQAFTQRMKG